MPQRVSKRIRRKPGKTCTKLVAATKAFLFAHYTHLVTFQDEDFIAKVAHSEQEICKLVEVGYEYLCKYNGNKIFRKRK